MDPNNPFLSNANTKFDENPTFVKQERLYMGLEQHGTDLVLPDTNLVFYDSTSSNGKHVEDVDGNDDYDYGDLGPETNVDTVDDAPDTQAPLDKLSRELIPGQKPEQQVTEDERDDNDRDDNDNNDNDERNENENQDRSEYYDFNRYNTAGVPYDGNGVIRTHILGKKDDENDVGTDDNVPCEHEADSDSRVVRSDARLDDDESPPSPPRDASKCNLSSIRTRLCAALVYGYAYHAVSNLLVSLATYISNSLGAHILGLIRRKWEYPFLRIP